LTGPQGPSLHQLASLALKIGHEQMENIERHARRSDADALASAVHALKNTLGVLKARDSVAVVEGIEFILRTQRTLPSPTALELLSREFGFVENDLRALLAGIDRVAH
jgi:hypothetical protein